MAQVLVLCFMILAVDAFLVLAAASDVEPNMADPPAFIPSNGQKTIIAEAPMIRKFLKNPKKVILVKSFSAPSSNPVEVEVNFSGEEAGNSQAMKEIYLKKHHHSADRSVAGGEVILGGLATTFLVAVFCYIRATRRKAVEPPSA